MLSRDSLVKRLLAVCILILASLASIRSDAFAQKADESADALHGVIDKVRDFRLSNGLRVIMYKRGFAPVFSGAVVVRVGGSDEVPGETGISHMFEHMAFKGTRAVGTKDYDREKKLLAELEEIAKNSNAAQQLSKEQKARWDEIEKELRKLWIVDDFTRRYDQEGASGQNATTDKEMTKYFVNLPRSAFEFWCRMESERLKAPVLRQFYQERDVVLEERRMRYEDDPQGRLYELLLGVAYMKHSYRNPVIGYESDIRSLTADRLDQFRRKYYVPSNMVIGLVGSVEPDQDIKMVEKYFGGIPVAPEPPRPVIAEDPQEGERRVVLRADAAPQIMLAYPKPNYPDPNDPVISVMSEILAGSKVSPLYVDLVQKKQIVSSIDVDEGPGMAYPNLLIFYALVKSPFGVDEALAAFDQVINRFKQNGPTEEQMEIAKRAIGMSLLDRLKANSSLAVDFASSELLYGTWKASADWYAQMLKVTPQEVKAAAEKYLAVDRRTIGIIEHKKK